MTELLDDLYHLEHQHNKRAYNKLVQLPVIQEELLWTALPLPKKNLIYALGSTLIIPLLIFAGLLMFEAVRAFSPSTLSIIFMSLVFLGAGNIVQEKIHRRNTFYGISATTIWIKKKDMGLVQYHIPSLTRLAINENTLSYSIITDQRYDKYTLLEDVPDIQPVYKLLLQLQQEQQSLH